MGDARQRWRQGVLAWLVTWVAGCVDAVGYLALYHIFTANMSGNTIRLGMALGTGDWREVLRRVYPVSVFTAGLLLSQTILLAGRRRSRGKAVRYVLLLEWLCLLAFLVLGWGWWGLSARPLGRPGAETVPRPDAMAFVVLAGLAGTAMGLQNAAVRQAGALSIHTTHVTGALTRLAGEIVAAVRRIRRGHRAGPHAPARRGSSWRVAFLAELWLTYLAGAAVGAAGLAHWGLLAMVFPLGVLAAATGVASVDLR